MILRVVPGFRKIEKLTEETGRKHDARVELWTSDRR